MKNFFKRFWKLLLIIGIILGVVLSPLREYLNTQSFVNLINSVAKSPYSALIYVGIYILGVIFLVPGIALTIVAAPIFGFWQGLALVIVASNIGCSLTYFISKFIGRGAVEKFIKGGSFLEKASNKIEENGFLFMLYVRALPIFPFNMVNYLSGLTGIKYLHYALATFIGMLPGSAVYVYLSYTASDIKNNPYSIIISVGILVIFTIATKLIMKKKKNIS